MKFHSWKEMAALDGTSISTQKRLQKTDPRYPRKVRLSPGRVGFSSFAKEAYDRARVEEGRLPLLFGCEFGFSLGLRFGRARRS